MEDELKSKLVEILTAIQTAAGKASDFAMEQLPDIAQSYVLYGRTSSLLGVLMAAALIGLAVFAFIWARNNARENDFGSFMAVMGGVISAVIGVVGMALAADSALLVWFAPKVWLLKEIASLLK